MGLLARGLGWKADEGWVPRHPRGPPPLSFGPQFPLCVNGTGSCRAGTDAKGAGKVDLRDQGVERDF